MTAIFLEMQAHVLATVQRELGLSAVALANVTVEAPREGGHGDLATNAAMVLAKPLSMKPSEIAAKLQPALAQHPMVAEVQVAGPGFLNFRLKEEALLEQAQAVATDAADELNYGEPATPPTRKALVEYVSINPTGPIHVGHGRNAVFGDAIANLLEKAGFTVWREYLVNDAGGQIRTLVLSLHVRYCELFGKAGEIPEGGYPGEYLIAIAEKLRERDGDKWLDIKDEKILLRELREFAVAECLALIKQDIATLQIKFDRYFSEFAMHQTDRMQEVVALLRAKGLVFEGFLAPPKGKTVADYTPVELTLFKATEFGLPDDQAVFNRHGQPTYFGQDIAYHYDKLQRGYELLVTVIGVDQAGAFKPLAKAIEALTGRDDVYHPVPYEMVKVLRNGEPVKLSKRAGNIVLLSDVLNEVGTDAFRFAMLLVKPTTPLTFDLAKAVEKSMENPVFYVQYAHARLSSVQRQAAEQGLQLALTTATLTQPARAVLREVMLYPAVVQQAARALEPHRLAFYAQQLAAAIHHWYAAEKWLDAQDAEATKQRLLVGRAAQRVLADVLRLCGVNAPEAM